jgi:hypothetical protein
MTNKEKTKREGKGIVRTQYDAGLQKGVQEAKKKLGVATWKMQARQQGRELQIRSNADPKARIEAER